jgi:hypothetical protein
MRTMQKEWSDQTAGQSNIEGLDFPADRYWHDCTVEMRGIHKLQMLETEVWTDKKVKSGSQDGEGTKTYQCEINGTTSVGVRGSLRNKANITGARGKVVVTCSYDENSVTKSESVKWGDRTGGNSLIYDLFLPDNHIWEKCSITIDFDKNSNTGCMVSLLKNGEMAYLPDGKLPAWVEKFGSGSVVYTFDINDCVPLVVSGYISNKNIGGGADIILTGFYKE